MSRSVLFAYSVIATIMFAMVVAGRTSTPSSATFDQITVRRINLVEPDGTPRLVISNHASFPGMIVHGKERPYPRPFAGMLFYNNEGTETGGLVFGGHKDSSGQVIDSGVSLTFDRYGAPQQIVQLAGIDDAQDRFSGLAINGFTEAGVHNRRLWVGRDASDSASVALMDAQGRKRIVMQVLKDGTASLQFVDEHGKVVKQITPDDH
jgi:hypothetical protein